MLQPTAPAGKSPMTVQLLSVILYNGVTDDLACEPREQLHALHVSLLGGSDSGVI
jgi:hypothetical protein